MTFQPGITIAGLGAGAPGDITLAAWEALKNSSRIFLRTGRHPVVEWLRRKGFSFITFDLYYEKAACFQEVYERIADAVLAEAGRGPVLYAVPGHPLVGEESVRLIVEKAKLKGIEVTFTPAVSFLDSLFSALRIDPGMGLQIVDGLRLDEGLPQPGRAAVVTQVYSRLVASDVKLSLLEVYPPQHPVTVVRGAGVPGEERIETIPLFELDRQEWIDHLTSLFIPPVKSRPPAEDSLMNEAAAGNERDPGRHGEVEVIQVCESEDVDKIQSADSCAEGQAWNEECGRRHPCRFPLDPLVDVMARLRGKEGCPWDREQDHRTLRPYLLEEAYEVLDALTQGDMHKTCEELGDLLLQIVFHAQIASESGHFDMNDVVAGIVEKMVRRHPHVFGSVKVNSSSEVMLNWEKIKAKEREGNTPRSLLSGVSRSLPALVRAVKIQEKAAGAGFDWPDYRGALEKTREELGELESVILSGDKILIERELGDLIFSVVNLARLLGVEPEAALSSAIEKFVRRFCYVEKMVQLAGRNFSQCTLSELDAWWEEAKKLEKM